mgnify:CR=1 FL=1
MKFLNPTRKISRTPSKLYFGMVASRPLHVVAAENIEDKEIIIITVYEPEKVRWTEDYRRRK